MKCLRWLLLPLLLAAGVCPAQNPAGGSPEPLPLRNLLIEVVQEDQTQGSDERLDAQAAGHAEPGQVGGRITLEAHSRQRRQMGRAQQQVLVLNGRAAVIVLRNSVALRWRQTFMRNGVRISVPGTVWLQADTGFTAIPIWEGGDSVQLSLAASQGRTPLQASARADTTLVLPLGEWVTVAESDESLDDQQRGAALSGGGQARQDHSRRLKIKIRVQLR